MEENLGKMSFLTANKEFFTGYFNFKGRSTRAAYWKTVPLQLFVGVLIGIGLATMHVIFSAILLLLFIIPLYAVLARRFRDVGLSNKGIVCFILLPFILTFAIPNASSTMINIFSYIIAAQPTDSFLTDSDSKLALFFLRKKPVAELEEEKAGLEGLDK